MIGILGLTGQTGQHIVSALANAGISVRVLAHTPESAKRITGDMVEVVTGGVREFSVCTSTADSLDNFSRWDHVHDGYLEKSGLPYTILPPHPFMQCIALQFAAGVRASGTMGAATSPARAIPMVDARDVAEYDSEELDVLGDAVPRLTGEPGRTLTDYLSDNAHVVA